MAIEIKNKIVGWKVLDEDKPEEAAGCTHYINSECAKENEDIPKKKREYKLPGFTYKIKPPIAGYGTIYITINDYADTPFEIFLNTKHTEHKQWMDAITRMMSSAFRRGESIQFLIKEMKQVHDGSGSYFMKGRNYPSVVAHIGWVIDEHINGATPTKKDLYEAVEDTPEPIEEEASTKPKATGKQCPECSEMTLIIEGGCTKCTNPECGHLGECG